VPIHDHLIEMGFLDFVREIGPGPLFYDPDSQRVARDDPTKPGQPPSVKTRNKLAEWVRSLGVTDPDISPLHAWRHTFKRRAARAGIEPRIRNTMCGHGAVTEGDKYETPTLDDLAEVMKTFPRYRL
jgi:integrase